MKGGLAVLRGMAKAKTLNTAQHWLAYTVAVHPAVAKAHRDDFKRLKSLMTSTRPGEVHAPCSHAASLEVPYPDGPCKVARAHRLKVSYRFRVYVAVVGVGCSVEYTTPRA